MRCLACNAALTESLATAKMPLCKEYWGLCGRCLNSIKGIVRVHNKQVVDREPDPAAAFLAERGFDSYGNERAAPAVDPDG